MTSNRSLGAGRWWFAYYGKRVSWMVQVADREDAYASHWTTGFTLWLMPKDDR